MAGRRLASEVHWPPSSIGNQQPSSRLQRRKNHESDRISSLPSNVIEVILVRLPLRDAARTSMLSRAWRYEWTKISELVFDEEFNIGCRDSKPKTIVDEVLMFHQGPIHKFKLSVPTGKSIHIDRWVRYVSTNRLREFSLLNEFSYASKYEVPTYLFSCMGITYLQLRNCSMTPPSTFNGFSNLRNLDLDDLDITNTGLEKLLTNIPNLKTLLLGNIRGLTCWKLCAPNLVDLIVESVSLESLDFLYAPLLRNLQLYDVKFKNRGDEDLIFSCPVLQKLRLTHITGCTRLNPYVPNLAAFVVEGGDFRDINLGSTPVLTDATIRLYVDYKEYESSTSGQECNITKLLGCSPAIKRLELHGDSHEGGAVPVRLHTDCLLTHFSANINLGEKQEMLTALCIFRSSPFLQELDIEGYGVTLHPMDVRGDAVNPMPQESFDLELA